MKDSRNKATSVARGKKARTREPGRFPDPDLEYQRQLAAAPIPTLSQARAFKAWHLKRMGEDISDPEASERLTHVAHLIFLLGGAEWLLARQRERQSARGRSRRAGG